MKLLLVFSTKYVNRQVNAIRYELDLCLTRGGVLLILSLLGTACLKHLYEIKSSGFNIIAIISPVKYLFMGHVVQENLIRDFELHV